MYARAHVNDATRYVTEIIISVAPAASYFLRYDWQTEPYTRVTIDSALRVFLFLRGHAWSLGFCIAKTQTATVAGSVIRRGLVRNRRRIKFQSFGFGPPKHIRRRRRENPVRGPSTAGEIFLGSIRISVLRITSVRGRAERFEFASEIRAITIVSKRVNFPFR